MRHEAADSALAAELRRINLITGAGALLWIVVAAFAGLWLSDRDLGRRLAAAATEAEQKTKAMSHVVAGRFSELSSIPQVLAANRAVLPVVRHYNARETAFAHLPEESRRARLQADPEVVGLSRQLTLIREKLRYDLIYVLDSRGIRIASSDWERQKAFLGTDLHDREYFEDAMAGKIGQMFAVSRTTQVPAFFFGAPIEDAGKSIGVVAVRQTTEIIGASLVTAGATVLIVDSRGMVVAASDPGFYLRHVSAADRALLRHDDKVGEAPDAEELREIYSLQSLRPMVVTRRAHHGMLSAPVHEAERIIDGNPYLITADPLKDYPAYSLSVLTPVSWVAETRRLQEMLVALVAAFGALVALLLHRRFAGLARRWHTEEVTAALNEKLVAANNEKNRYLGIAAHDLRNPLSSMRGLSQIMLGTPLEPEQQKEFLETIYRTSDEMLGLVNDLLDVAVIESGKLDLRYKDLDVGKLVQQRLRHLEPHAAGKKITVTLDGASVQTARLDPARFGQVIDNLVSNAIKFSPSGTTVRVVLQPGAGSFILSVQDEGPGIAEADRKLLFRSFQKLSARPTGGEKSTGLGLAIVKKIVDAHGGRIEVESEPGHGTRFIVTTPLAAQGAG